MYNKFIYQPILSLLLFLYNALGANLGVAIIALTLLVRAVLVPLTLPSMRSAQKMAKLKPELDALKKKYKKDPKVFQQKQLELYKQHNINPIGGCLPYIVQLIFLIALYRVFIDSLGNGVIGSTEVNTTFLIWDLKDRDSTYILPVLAGLLQLLTSLSLTPAIENEPEKRKGTKEEKENIAEMAGAMQKQMVFLMPAITFFFALQFPAGLALYWVVTTAFSFVQQLIISGPGGLMTYARRIGLVKTNVKNK